MKNPIVRFFMVAFAVVLADIVQAASVQIDDISKLTFLEYAEATNNAALVNTEYIAVPGKMSAYSCKGRFLVFQKYAGLFSSYINEDANATRLILTESPNAEAYANCAFKASSARMIGIGSEGSDFEVSVFADGNVRLTYSRTSGSPVQGNENNNPIMIHPSSGTRVYYLDFYEFNENSGAADQLVRHFLPAKDEHGVIGYYETITKRFYTPDSDELSAEGAKEFSRVTYYCEYVWARIYGSHDNPWIDTLYVPNEDTVIQFKGQFMGGVMYDSFFAAYSSENAIATRVITTENTSANNRLYVNFMAKAGGPYVYNYTSTLDGVVLEGYLKNGEVQLNDDDPIQFIPTPGSSSDSSIVLMGGDVSNHYGNHRLYWLKILEKGKVKHWYLPKVEDGVAGLYEAKSGVFYPSPWLTPGPACEGPKWPGLTVIFR